MFCYSGKIMAEADQGFVEHDGNHDLEQIPENQEVENQVPGYEVPEYEVPEVPQEQVPQDQVTEEHVTEDEVTEDQITEDQVTEDQVPEDQVPEDHVPEDHVSDDQVPEDIVPEDSQLQEKQENEVNLVVGTTEKKWPGWPGESVFRMLVPAQKVGSIIGRKGEFIKKIVEETRARIKILDGPPGTTERAVSFHN